MRTVKKVCKAEAKGRRGGREAMAKEEKREHRPLAIYSVAMVIGAFWYGIV